MEKKSTKIIEVKTQWDSTSKLFRDKKAQNTIKIGRINSSNIKKFAKKAYKNRVFRDNLEVKDGWCVELEPIANVEIASLISESHDVKFEHNRVVISSIHQSKYKKAQLKKHTSKHRNISGRKSISSSAGPSGSPKK